MDDAATIGRGLAARHAHAVEPDTERSLVNYAESARAHDWSMRSALVRLAQPEPVRAGQVLECVRRCDGALARSRRALEQHGAVTDRRIVDAAADAAGGVLPPPLEPRHDIRVADLARLLAYGPSHFGALLDAYQAEAAEPLSDDELVAVPLLGVASTLDELADVLADWATTAAEPPPVGAIDATVAAAASALDAMGVPRETGGPPSRRR